MPTRRISGTATAASDPDNGGDHSGGGGGTYVDDVFSTYLYEGNGGTQTITNGIDLAGEGGLVWVKNRTSGTLADRHVLTDTEHPKSAQGFYPFLSSNGTDALNPADQGNITNWNTDGFTSFGSYNWTNKPSEKYVSWTFRKAKNFFDVVTYTGDGTVRQIPHSLGCVPGTIIVKRTDSADNWYVQHRSTGPTQSLFLDMTTGATTRPDWGNTAPTSSEFTVDGTAVTATNASGAQYVAYLFAHDDSDESMIKCGGYTGTGSDLSIDLGFEPQWVLFKKTNEAVAWVIRDNMRGTTDSFRSELYPNSSDAEYNHTSGPVVFTPTGFRLPIQNGLYNTSGDTFIYMAIRRPNKPADEFEADDLFAVAPRSNTVDADNAFVSNFPVDAGMSRSVVSSTEMRLGSRMTGEAYLQTPLTNAEISVSLWGGWDSMNSARLGYGKSDESPVEKYGWMWRRAPGFFDVVAYEGDGSEGRSVPHNLGAFPELIIAKVRSRDQAWFVRHNDTAGGLLLNTDEQAQPYYWNDTDTPTDEFFKVSRNYAANMPDEQYIAYLFASVPGISKVGSYTGGGSNQVTVRCGFTTGVKFLLVKCASSNGDWAVWDAERGFTASWNSNPYIKLNSTEAQTPGSDQSPTNVSWGFVFAGSSSPRTFNALGEEYIYYAIAN